MNVKQMTLLGLFGLAIAPIAIGVPASACTPAPDNPNGCDGINGPIRIQPYPYPQEILRPQIPYPEPVCLSCPPIDRLDARVLLEKEPEVLQIQPEVIQESQLLEIPRAY